jgi:hypothetical protein
MFSRKNTRGRELIAVDWQCRVGAFHERHRASQVRPQHRRSPLLYLLRRTSTGRGSSGKEIWHGALGAELYAALGHLDGAAYLGSGKVAALSSEDTHRLLGR